MTYDELKTKIRDYTEVDSNVFTDTIINGFFAKPSSLIELSNLVNIHLTNWAKNYISNCTTYPIFPNIFR